MDNNLSNCFKSEIGVKQGDNLSPTLSLTEKEHLISLPPLLKIIILVFL
jgi:hypothetical protein